MYVKLQVQLKDFLNSCNMYVLYTELIQMDDCWEDMLCVIIFYSVTIAWQYNILYNTV